MRNPLRPEELGMTTVANGTDQSSSLFTNGGAQYNETVPTRPKNCAATNMPRGKLLQTPMWGMGGGALRYWDFDSHRTEPPPPPQILYPGVWYLPDAQ